MTVRDTPPMANHESRSRSAATAADPPPSAAEWSRLLHLVRAAWDPSGRVPPPAASGAEDWTATVQMALDHCVAGLLCYGLQQIPPAAVPAGMIEAADAFLVQAQAQGRARIAELFAILDTLAGDGLAALAFKGPALGKLAYGGAWIRPSRDFDVLVARKDMDRAIAALARLGYSSDAADLSPRATAACHDSVGQARLYAEGRTAVEPHCTFARAALATHIDMGAVWTRSQTIAIEGRALPTLGDEDTMLVICLNGWKDHWCRLRGVADVAAFLHRHPTLDWDALTVRAQQSGIRRILHLGLALAQDLFHSTLPDHVVRAIAAERDIDWLLQESKAWLMRPVPKVPLRHRVSRYRVLSRERIADRVSYVWRTMTTPRVTHFRMLKLPDPLFRGYFAVKLAHDYVALPVWRLTAGWRAHARTGTRGAPT